MPQNLSFLHTLLRLKLRNWNGATFWFGTPLFQTSKVRRSISMLQQMTGLHVWSCQHQKRNNSAKTILRDLLQKWKAECCGDNLVPMRFAIFPSHLSKVLRLPRKSEARSYDVLRLSRKIILANLKISSSKIQPVSGNLRPLLLPCEMHLCRSSSSVPRLPSFRKLLQNPRVKNPLRLPRKIALERPKVAQACYAF